MKTQVQKDKRVSKTDRKIVRAFRIARHSREVKA